MSQHEEEKGVINEDGEYSVSSSRSHVGDHRGLSTRQKAAQDERATLAKQESKAISYLRWIVLLVLFIVGSTFAALVFRSVRKQQVEQFQDDFRYYAEQVTDTFNSQLKRTLDAQDTPSTEMTSHALTIESVFPFVTLPDFEFRGANARITGDTTMISYMPAVKEEIRVQWETYAAAHQNHIATAYASEQISKVEQDSSFGKETPEYHGLALDLINDPVYVDTSKIWPAYENATQNHTYFPLWQQSPLVPVDAHNLDVVQLPLFDGAMVTSANTGEVVFGMLFELRPVEAGTMSQDKPTFDMILQSGQYRHSTERYENDPQTPMIYPVFDGFGQDRKVGGLLYTTIYWRFLMMGILPDNIRGIVCVVKSSIGQFHTFQVNGGDAVHLGEGDSHDVAYNDMAQSIDLVTKLKETAGPESRSFTAAGVNGQFMNYTLTVYPSDDFKAIFVNSRAEKSAGTIAATFVVAICLFLIYDYYVQRRQRIVLDRAVRATAVVSSLYPANVREQIINDEDNNLCNSDRRAGAFLRSTVEESASKGLNPTPLATKYPDCTVYFADLTGFTKWSATREPEMVFQLLEAIFKEVDAAATKRGVFKVETIGDCYMAVTGLPNAQPDHAVLMAKFAHDCMTRLDHILERLATSLGEGTDDLALRTGMHSGEVTAGVLRGDKGRFQLFGDTVNTASRMESTGTPRKFQVSQSTADALIMGGKEHWLIPRNEKVFAKGKGEVQTYFLQMKEQTERTASISLCSAGS